ncbi:MAG: DUF1570 domain-containing protein [Blastocatellia bacterium]
MKRSVRLLIILTVILLAILPGGKSQIAAIAIPPAAKDTWTSVRSKNFFLAGNASEKDIRKAAIKLEQFRDVFTMLFPKAKLSSSVPTRVLVFKDKGTYKPFMPVYQGKINEVAGFFQPGSDINYITLTAELRDSYPYSTVFHEFVHSLTNENSIKLPTWFNEGLADYYSTFEITDGDKKVWLGKVVANHVLWLRQKQFLSLPQLFAITTGSSDYNEKDKKGVFYAQSWALVHYLMLGADGIRRPQLSQFLGLLGRGIPQGEAFNQAFKTDYVTMEKELRDYINRDSYKVEVVTVNEKLQFDTSMQASPMSEAEAQYYLGDLLLHMRRNDAEGYLQNAIAIDPKLALAHSSLGVLRMQQKRIADAKRHLQQAVSLGSDNHLVHYYYAFALSREGMDENNVVQSFSPESIQAMRDHLEKAMQIAPNFAESYYLMAFVNLVTGEKLDSAIGQLKRVLTLTPGRQEVGFLMGQIYLRQQKFDLARQALEPIAHDASEQRMQEQAQSIIETIKNMEESMARDNSLRQAAETSQPTTGGNSSETSSTPIEGKQKILLRRRFDGDKVKGQLTQIDCSDKGMTLIVQSGDRKLKFSTNTPDRVEFITFTQDIGSAITCGPIKPGRMVEITYRSSTDAKSPFDGEPIAVEFIKQDQN